jgi:glycosyltransferase involved in cell wall biosynthesis
MKVSVVIPYYKGSNFIESTIKSVLDQTHKDLEIIIVDDCSQDNLSEIIQPYNIRLITNECNMGIPKTMNAGIKVSTGDYIAFLDQDDIWYPNKLELQLQEFNSSENIGLVECDIALVVQNNKIIGTSKINPDATSKHDILKHIYLSTHTSSTMMIKRECFDTMGLLDENRVGWTDFEIAFRIATRYNVGYVNEILVFKNLHSASSSSKMGDGIRDEAKLMYREMCEYHPFLREYLPMKEGAIISCDVIDHIKNGEYGTAQKVSLESITQYPTLKNKFRLLYLLASLRFIGVIILHTLYKLRRIF